MSSTGYIPTMPRVLMVTPRFHPMVGGIETHVREVSRRLASMGVAVTVLTTDPSGQLPPREVVGAVELLRVRAWPSKRDYYLAPGVARVMAEQRWDLVHVQGCHTLVPPLAMASALRLGLPYVVSFHSGGSSSQLRGTLRGVQWQALRPLLARARRLIGPSRWEVRYFERQLALPAERFVVVPNGANSASRERAAATTETNPAAAPHEPPGAPGDSRARLIVSLGRLERYKGHQYMIAAMPRILAQEPAARLRIVGVGPYEAALRRQVARLGLSAAVEIAGIPPGEDHRVTELLLRADVVTLLSEHEAQGIAILDALTLGRPVVVAQTTALAEFVEHGQAIGVPARPAPDTVAVCVLRQLRDPLRPAAAVTLPTWEDCAAGLLTLYRHALALPHPALASAS